MRKLPILNTIIIKIGSSILTNKAHEIDSSFIKKLSEIIANLKKKSTNIIIVSSGSVAAGFKTLGFDKRPSDINEKQACAAVGQTRLMWHYEKEL
jgi:glutamate 5-kinase